MEVKMKFDNPFLRHLAKKYQFNTLNEWCNYIQDCKDINNMNQIELLIYELSTISGYTFKELTGKCRKRDLTDVKHIGRYIAWKNSLGSLKEIAFVFGGKDHSTIIHSRDFVMSMIDGNDRSFHQLYNKFKHLVYEKV